MLCSILSGTSGWVLIFSPSDTSEASLEGRGLIDCGSGIVHDYSQQRPQAEAQSMMQTTMIGMISLGYIHIIYQEKKNNNTRTLV